MITRLHANATVCFILKDPSFRYTSTQIDYYSFYLFSVYSHCFFLLFSIHLFTSFVESIWICLIESIWIWVPENINIQIYCVRFAKSSRMGISLFAMICSLCSGPTFTNKIIGHSPIACLGICLIRKFKARSPEPNVFHWPTMKLVFFRVSFSIEIATWHIWSFVFITKYLIFGCIDNLYLHTGK